MATRLSVITTRTGDAGETGLGDGSRIGKDAPRIAALGDVDELNSTIGLLRTHTLPDDIDTLLDRIQHDLFDLGAELSIPGHLALGDAQVAVLDDAIQRHNADLGKLQEFILPGVAAKRRTPMSPGRYADGLNAASSPWNAMAMQSVHRCVST